MNNQYNNFYWTTNSNKNIISTSGSIINGSFLAPLSVVMKFLLNEDLSLWRK